MYECNITRIDIACSGVSTNRVFVQGWGLLSQLSPFRYFLIFGTDQTVVNCMISGSYLAGVTAAELRRHLANMNMIGII